MILEMDGLFFVAKDDGGDGNLYPRLVQSSIAAAGCADGDFVAIDHGSVVSMFGRQYEVNALDGLLELVLLDGEG